VKLPMPATQVVHRPGPALPTETRGSNTPKVPRHSAVRRHTSTSWCESDTFFAKSKLDQALDEVKSASRHADTPKKEEEEKVDTLERKRRERNARRAAEAEALRLEQEAADASIERRKKEREERRKAREAESKAHP
jgi:hypothetical protein